MRKIVYALFIVAKVAIITLTFLFMYNAGKRDGAEEVILSAQPFIVDYVEYPADYFTLYIDYGEPHGVHEYVGFVG